MAALNNIFSGFDINKNFNDSYNGPLFQIQSEDSGSSVFIDVEQNADGEPDLTALQNHASWNATHDWAFLKAYDPWGNTDWFLVRNKGISSNAWTNGAYPKFYDGTTQSFSENADGKLVVPQTSNGIAVALTNINVPLSQYSIFVRQELLDPTDTVFSGLVGTIEQVTGQTPNADQGSSDPATGINVGTPSYYKNGVSQSWTTRDDVWSALNAQLSTVGVVNFDLTDGRTVSEPLYIFEVFPTNNWGSRLKNYTSVLLYTGDVGAQAGDIQTMLDDAYDPTIVPKATFTDEVGSPIQGGHVLWIEETAFAAADPSWNAPVIVSSTGTTDANGEVSYTGTVDPVKVYTAVLRDYEYVNEAWEKSQGSDTGQQNVDLTAPA